MGAKPGSLPIWATTPEAAGPTYGQNGLQEPSSGKKATGWVEDEMGVYPWDNWYKNLVYQWLDYLDTLAGSEVSNDSSVTGANVSAALNKLKTDIGALAASDIDNDTTLSGGIGTLKFALDSLDSSISKIGSLLQKKIIGLTLSNGSDDLNDIDIDVGACTTESGSFTIVNTSAFTKQIDAVWAAGTNQGGRPSAVSLTNDTNYNVFAIYKSSTGEHDFGFDTSLTAANLLNDSGYDEYRRLGTILYTQVAIDNSTSAVSGFIKFTQIGDDFIYRNNAYYDYSLGGDSINSAVLLKASPGPAVPSYSASAGDIFIVSNNLLPSVKVKVDMSVDVEPGVSGHIRISSSYVVGESSVQNGYELRSTASPAPIIPISLWTELGRLSVSTSTTAPDFTIRVRGYKDPRGQY